MNKQHPLYRYRAKHGITMVQLAKDLDCGQATISMIEAGTRMPSPAFALRIQKKTGIRIKDMRPDLADIFGDA